MEHMVVKLLFTYFKKNNFHNLSCAWPKYWPVFPTLSLAGMKNVLTFKLRDIRIPFHFLLDSMQAIILTILCNMMAKQSCYALAIA